MDKEMNFFDLCVLCCRAIGRGCAACLRFLAHMLKVSYRYWWLVLTLMILAAAAALYYTRYENQKFCVNAVAILNGPSISQFEQVYTPLRSGLQLPDEMPLKELVQSRKIRDISTYRVIDCLRDSVADYIDFKGVSSPIDTINVQMQDRLCLQFRIKQRDLALIPEVEKEMLSWLNENEALQRSYKTYMENLLKEVQFNHSQMAKLDSLTTHYYFHAHHGDQPRTGIANGVVWVGDWSVHLFLGDIYRHQCRTERWDQRLQLATAPVVLENHFAVDARPLNSRVKYLCLFLLLAWIGGYVIAEVIDKRKAIAEWLKA